MLRRRSTTLRDLRPAGGVDPDATAGAVKLVREVHSGLSGLDWAELVRRQEPLVVRGALNDWPMVQAARLSDEAAIAYLRGFVTDTAATCLVGEAAIGGRFGYTASVTGVNFTAERMPLSQVLARLAATIDDDATPSLYVGSTDVDTYLPGFRLTNDLEQADPSFAAVPPIVSIWLGNRTTAIAHYDMSNNIACCLAGTRRFTLFPPEQIGNLYPGPLEPTPGGQVISMVDIADPDLDRHPKFKEALAVASSVELAAGDLIFYPALWWHQVEALGPFNAMMNYWWNDSPAFLDSPWNTVLHAMLSLRDRSEAEKAAWRNIFDYYVFGDANVPREHLPEDMLGPLGVLDSMTARRLRAMILNRLNR